MQLEIIILSELSQKDKDKIPCDIIFMCNITYDTNETVKQKQNRNIKNTLMVAKGEGDAKVGVGVWD